MRGQHWLIQRIQIGVTFESTSCYSSLNYFDSFAILFFNKKKVHLYICQSILSTVVVLKYLVYIKIFHGYKNIWINRVWLCGDIETLLCGNVKFRCINVKYWIIYKEKWHLLLLYSPVYRQHKNETFRSRRHCGSYISFWLDAKSR